MSNEIKERPTMPVIMELPGFSVTTIGESVYIEDPDSEIVGFLGPGKHAKYPDLHRAIQQHIQDYREKQG